MIPQPPCTTALLLEAAQAVEQINAQIPTDTEETLLTIDLPPTFLLTDGFDAMITYLHTVIWTSEEDERDVFEDGTPEPLTGFVIRKLHKTLDEFKKSLPKAKPSPVR